MKQHDGSCDRYAVMGNPIEHSKSPFIHALFAEQTGQRLEYGALLVPEGGFDAAAQRFRSGGGRGLNVTLPFKEDACRWVRDLAERARLAGAVNTVVFEPGRSARGDNTDGVGLVRDLTQNHGLSIGGRRVLVVGAGGAVRGVLPSLLSQSPESVLLVNRTFSRAADLVARFEGLGSLAACPLDGLAGMRFDLVINGTAASLSGHLPDLPDGLLDTGAVCYDMAYASQTTPFVQWGSAQGASESLDGLGMLVEQAAESFRIWRGVRPETGPVIAALR